MDTALPLLSHNGQNVSLSRLTLKDKLQEVIGAVIATPTTDAPSIESVSLTVPPLLMVVVKIPPLIDLTGKSETRAIINLLLRNQRHSW